MRVRNVRAGPLQPEFPVKRACVRHEGPCNNIVDNWLVWMQDATLRSLSFDDTDGFWPCDDPEYYVFESGVE